MNIQLNFCYCNCDNVRVHSGASFSNPDGLSIYYIEAVIREYLIADRYFVAPEWLPLSLALADHDGLVEIESIDQTSGIYTAGSINILLDSLSAADSIITASVNEEFGVRKAA